MVTETEKTFGQNLRRLRMNAHMSQNDLCIKLQLLGQDISRSRYSQIELGTYTSVDIATLKALTIIYNVDYDTLFYGL